MARGFEGFGGFQFRPSADIKSEFQAGIQQALTSGNKDAARMAVAANAAFALTGGNEEYRASKKRERVLKDALKGVEKTGDELDDQIAYYEAAQEAAVEAGLPDIAFQATEKLSALRLTQEERRRLQAQEEDRAEAHEQDIEMGQEEIELNRMQNLYNRTGVIVDPSEDPSKSLGIINLTTDEGLTQYEEIRQTNPNAVFTTMDNWIDLNEAHKDRQNKVATAARQLRASKAIEKRKYAEHAVNTSNFALTADQFADVLTDEDAQLTFGIGGQGAAGIEKAGAQGRSVVGALFGPEVVDYNEAQFQNNPAFNALNSERKALVMELGFALATAREGGRLTDQDIDRAIISLGVENPDPRAVAWVFGRVLYRAKEQHARRATLMGLAEDPDTLKAEAMVSEDINKPLAKIMQHFGLTEEDLSTDKGFDKLFGEDGDTPIQIPSNVTVTPLIPDEDEE